MGAVTDPRVWFVRSLQKLMRDAGGPTLRELERSVTPKYCQDSEAKPNRQLTYRASSVYGLLPIQHLQKPRPLPRATVSDLLNEDVARSRTEAPEWMLVATFVLACVSWAYEHGRGTRAQSVQATAENALVEFVQRHSDLSEMLDAELEADQQKRVRVNAVPALADKYQPRAVELSLDTILKPPAGAQRRGGDSMALTQVLSGTGGVGKTQLAAAHARLVWDDPRVALAAWVPAGSRTKIITAYARAAAQLMTLTAEEESDPELAAARLVEWLANSNRPWLIVLDDLWSLQDLNGLWPPTTPGKSGHVIVTTRRRDAALNSDGRAMLAVDVFTEHESRNYLTLKLINHPLINQKATGISDQIDGLANDLGQLPLALAQAIAYIIDRRLTVADYRRRFADRKRALPELLPEPGALPDSHTQTVATTWSLSVDLAETLAPRHLAGHVLLVAALLDPAGAPYALFTSASSHEYFTEKLARRVTADDIADTLQNLHRLSLLEFADEQPHRTVRVHALIQRATREAASDEIADEASLVCADSLIEIWPEFTANADLVQSLQTNTIALIANSGSLVERVHEIVFQIGKSYGESGFPVTARNYFQGLHEVLGGFLEYDHYAILVTRNNLAYWHGRAGDPAGAATLTEELLTDAQRALGQHHFQTLTIHGNLAFWRGRAGHPADAAAMAQELLIKILRVHGPDHPHTFTTRHNIAAWRGEAGDPTRAVALFKELLLDQRRALGPEHASTLATRSNLARWHGMAGNYADATAELKELHADRQRLLGDDHPDTLATRSDLAHWRGQAGDSNGAVSDFEALIADLRRVLEPDHPEIITARSNLYSWTGESGAHKAAVAGFEELLPDALQILSPNHPGIFAIRNNLARWRGAVGDAAGAAAAAEGLLVEQIDTFGRDHPDTMNTRNNLANWRGEAGSPETAVRDFEELLLDAQRIFGSNHPDTLLTRGNLASWRGHSGDISGAVIATQEVLSDMLRILGPSNPHTLTTRENLTFWQRKLR